MKTKTANGRSPPTAKGNSTDKTPYMGKEFKISISKHLKLKT